MPRPRRRRALAACLAGSLVAVAAGCGGGDQADGACGPITREALDPAYLVHVLGDDTGVQYKSDPPTSGPHQAGPPVEGVVGEAITRPVQVGILERGDVLLQHSSDLPDAQRKELEALAGPGVVVATNDDLPDAVVATAWTYKRTCTSVDVDQLREFIEARAGKGPES